MLKSFRSDWIDQKYLRVYNLLFFRFVLFFTVSPVRNVLQSETTTTTKTTTMKTTMTTTTIINIQARNFPLNCSYVKLFPFSTDNLRIGFILYVWDWKYSPLQRGFQLIHIIFKQVLLGYTYILFQWNKTSFLLFNLMLQIHQFWFITRQSVL